MYNSAGLGLGAVGSAPVPVSVVVSIPIVLVVPVVVELLLVVLQRYASSCSDVRIESASFNKFTILSQHTSAHSGERTRRLAD